MKQTASGYIAVCASRIRSIALLNLQVHVFFFQSVLVINERTLHSLLDITARSHPTITGLLPRNRNLMIMCIASEMDTF